MGGAGFWVALFRLGIVGRPLRGGQRCDVVCGAARLRGRDHPQTPLPLSGKRETSENVAVLKLRVLG